MGIMQKREYPPSLDIALIEQQASKLIDKSGMEDPPFIMRKLAYMKGVKKIVETDLKGIDALLLPDEDGYLIKLNSVGRSFSRQNFSLAHEIAHILLLESGKGVFTAKARYSHYENSRVEEDLCDIGAAELLMPKSVFVRYASQYDFSLICLQLLARAFRTSIIATVRRLLEVHPDTCLAIFWKFRDCTSSSEKKLRVQYSVHPRTDGIGSNHFIPQNVSANENSSVIKAFRTDELRSEERGSHL